MIKDEIEQYIRQFDLLETPFKLPLFSSIMIHVALLLLVGFAVSRIDVQSPQPNLRITLTNSITSEAPEDSDVLAQFDNVGGSDDKSETLAKTYTEPQSLPNIDPSDITRKPSIAQHRRASELPTLLSLSSAFSRNDPKAYDDNQRTDTTAEEDRRMAFSDTRLSATLDDHLEKLSNGERHQYISVATRQYDFAAYMAIWVKKVESIGNSKIPSTFRQQDLTGDLVLDAAINIDGSVNSVTVWRSSGIDTLDRLARQIVFDAAPYAPLDAAVRAKTDVLHIIRTWRFNTRTGLTDISQ